jgi:excinuclease ABC subunit C
MSLKDIALSLPEKPGVYQFFNHFNEIIYIGKAKNLKKRVTSYFNKNHTNRKLLVMVSKIENIRHIVVNTESDALLLENNLIKQYKPRYNILLKDDKTYPWICIKNENFPRVFLTRKMVNDGSSFYGPYTSALMVRTLLNLIKQLYQIRSCSLNLSHENITAHKFNVCLEYHIGNCKGPCVGLQTSNEYSESITQIKAILKGNIDNIIDYLNDKMHMYAKELNFELAQKINVKIELLKKFQSKSLVVNADIKDVDILSIESDAKIAYVNFMRVVKGSIVYSYTLEFAKRLDEDEKEIILFAIVEMRERTESTANEIILPFDPELELSGLKFTIPKIGDKYKLLELSQRNLRLFKLEKERRVKKEMADTSKKSVLELMKRDLNLPELPIRIECFDNSNIQGTNPVASCVVFINGKPAKSEYRHFNVKTVVGADDFATMEEILFRRYDRMIRENQKLPQLIVIDGGKGQLSSALSSIRKLGIENQINLIGIAKRLEEIFNPYDNIPLYLDRNSPALKVIQHIRNEAHRFGIEFHRLKRSNSMLKSELDEIKGIGKKTKDLLLETFGDIHHIQIAEFDSLVKAIGQKKATLLLDHFNASGKKEL